MSINLQYAIIHQLKKEQHKPLDYEKCLSLRDKVLDEKNKLTIELANEVADLFNRKNNYAIYGLFNGRGQRKGNFPDHFESYFQNKGRNENDFIQLSKQLMDELRDRAGEATLSSGGYIFFAEYHRGNNNGRFFLAAMIKQQDVFRVTDDLDPEILESLDLKKLSQAVRINYSKYERQQESYLSFVSPSNNKEISGYFIDALGCRKGKTPREITTRIIEKSVNCFNKDERLKPYTTELRGSVIDYLIECNKNEVTGTLNNLSRRLKDKINSIKELNELNIADEVIDNFIAKLNSDEFGISEEFGVSQQSINKYEKIAYKDKWGRLEFKIDRGLLGKGDGATVQYDDINKRLIFNNLDDNALHKIKQAIQEDNL